MAENVLIKYGHFEVEKWRMQDYVQQAELNEAERERIIQNRHMFLDWMHRHFAEKIIPPPAEITEK